jgi:serine/threonine protein kinase
LGGKYRLLRPLGRGASGQVYEAEQLELGRRYAIKVLHRPLETPRSKQRFEREARVLARLEHENIVGLIDAGADAKLGDYLVLELIRGSTLRQALPALTQEGPERTVGVAAQIARGLGHAHSMGVVHRDLKPENIMLTSHADGRPLVKILDFGIARLFDGARDFLTQSGAALGTAAYMAPEQARGDRDLDLRIDVYALGVIVYEILSGVRPFEGNSYNETLFHVLTRKHVPLGERRPDLPPALGDAVERALQKDRAERFATVEAFAAALSSAVRPPLGPVLDSLVTLDLESEERTTTRPSSSVTSIPAPARIGQTRGRPSPVAVALMAAGLGFGLGWAWRVDEAKAPRAAESAPHSEPMAAPLVSAAADGPQAPATLGSSVPPLLAESAHTSDKAAARLPKAEVTVVPSAPHKPPPAIASARPGRGLPKDRGF